MAVPPATRELVRERANARCEYCRLPYEEFAAATWFVVEHIRPQSEFHEDDPLRDDPENLAWACPRCNGYKLNKTQAIDPETKELCTLFDPRKERWEDHFVAQPSGLIAGRTPKGRATREALQLDAPCRVLNRKLLVNRRKWP